MKKYVHLAALLFALVLGGVAKAEATHDGSTLKVLVELRAPNYPGSTYTLSYDREHDQLRGIYFQAVQQQSFNVSFVRMK